ncbi:syntaxin-11-like [Mugil cephalus]|uniref:syntaxin-11-like n=1 Tax=Mugil cephalus TaxID=48193 RepID=UPI001FB79CE6|nr:syntaxin-11-like [Mugil cephalus]
MRDRMGHLQQVTSTDQQVDSEGFSSVQLDNLPHSLDSSLEHEAAAAAAESDPDLDVILKEAQQIHVEIQQIQSDISELRDVNYQALNIPTWPVATKRDSNAIGADIKRRGEAVLHRLHKLNDLRAELEAQRGISDPTARIARTQYCCLSTALQDVMTGYNDVEMSHKDACKRQIQRQMEVVGREVSEEELDEMVSGQDVCVFSDQMQGKTTRSALMQIESRQQELLELEKRIEGIQELFLDVALLVEEQGVAVENIQKNVQNTEVIVQDAVRKLERAKASDKNNPIKKLFCGCFPCYNT